MNERLTMEDFKKIFENVKVEGFSYNQENQRMTLPHGGWNIDDSSIWNNPSWVNLFYPLLLTKVVEGMQLTMDSKLVVRSSFKATKRWVLYLLY